MKKLLIGASLIGLVAAPAIANHQWGNYHWARSSNPLTLTVNVAVGSQWDTSVNGAIADWDQSSVLDLTTATPGGINARKCDPISGQIVVCADAYGQRGWLGIASIWASGDHITQGTTKLNDSYYVSGGYYDTPAWRALVACQEIGHDFGLGHQDENFSNPNLNTCMDYTNNPESNQHPNQHDYDLLATMYSHLDGGGGGGGGGGNCNPKSPKCSGQDAFTFRTVGQPHPDQGAAATGSWGQAVGFDHAGRPNTFLLDLGNGNRRITHVFWVPGFRPQPEHMHD